MMTVQMSNKTHTSEVSFAKTIKIMMGQQQRNMSLQAPVQRPTPGDCAAYLHPDLSTSILSNTPQNTSHDVQKRRTSEVSIAKTMKIMMGEH